MRKNILLFLFIIPILGFSQKTLPKVNVKDLNGNQKLITEIAKHNGPVVISFWATWCKPCINELDAINESLDDLVEEENLKFIAVSVDDSRSKSKVKSFINAKGWEFDIFLDENQDLKRAMNINVMPHIVLLNKKGIIVWEHSSYTPGSEEELFEKIKEVNNVK